jgi:hydroxymethylbilane synthase
VTASPIFRIGTRGSDLALWQARRVSERAREELGLECELEIIATKGDRVQDMTFHKMEGKGFFTKELQQALLDRRVDLVVHSLKDLPTEEPEGLRLTAIPERASPADSLLARSGALAPTAADPLGLREDAVLGTSSLRRAAQSLSLRPDLKIVALRGNVPTRVDKLRDRQYDAILLAAAGIDRLQLDLDGLERIELPPEAMLPAPGQGALAIETRDADPLADTISRLHDEDVADCAIAERRLLQLLGGGCHLPLGCLATAQDGGFRLQAVLGHVDEEISRAEVARVGAVAASPQLAATACFEALSLAMPEVVGA